MVNQYITIVVDFDPYLKKRSYTAKRIKERFETLTFAKPDGYFMYLLLCYARISKPVHLDLGEYGKRTSDKMCGVIIILEYLGARDDIPKEKERLTWICSDLKKILEKTKYTVIWGRDINF